MSAPSVTTYATRDEAIAAALIDAADGEEWLIHEAHCAMRPENTTEACTCEPVLLVVRRGAA